jgi:cytochrome c553
MSSFGLQCRIRLALAAFALALSTSAAAQGDVARGGAVYASTCTRCHESDPMRDRPAGAARRENGVLTAIETIGVMRSLRTSLTLQQIADVQAWLDFVVLPAGAIRPQTGVYWNPAQPGSGFFLEYGAGFAALASFHYADDGRPDWAFTSARYAGTVPGVETALVQFRNGQTLVGPWQPSTPQTTTIASNLRFVNEREVVLQLPGREVALRRLALDFGTQPVAPAPGLPQSGLWWNPQESGRGFIMEFQGSELYLAAFVFDADGRPSWYTALGPVVGRNRFNARWQRFADGQTLTGAFRPARALETDSGPVSIEFETTRRAIITMPDGRRVPIERYF